MKRIGVCACYDTKNYGSVLQTLATCRQLEKLGYEYEIIRYSRKMTFDFIMRSIGRTPEYISKKIKQLKDNNKLSRYPEIIKGIRTRNNRFEECVEKYFKHFSPVYNTLGELSEAATGYDAVLVGSDQLWRPEGFSTGFYNLIFVPDNIPKISYATSFGVSQIPINKEKSAKKFLNRIEFISVRELRAAEIIKSLTNRDATVAVDPTLLFTGEEWAQVIPSKNVLPKEEKYIFCYLLGTNSKHRETVKYLSEKSGCKIVTIPHLDEFVECDIKFGDIQLYDVGPEDFVNLIRNAEYVCTDSFHGTVFSILNHKLFITFNRFNNNDSNSRNSRIESLLTQTNLQERLFSDYNDDAMGAIHKSIDYEKVEIRLSEMRKKSFEFLEGALNSV